MTTAAQLDAEARIRVLVGATPGATHALRYVLDAGPVDVLDALLAGLGIGDHVGSIGSALTRRRAAAWALSADDAELGIRHLTRALLEAGR